MCGIAGYVAGRPLDRERIRSALRHRGPDDTGDFSAEVFDRHIYLTHHRLSIIDLTEAGHQPMATPDGMIVINYNGEIYNFEALRDRYLKDVTLKSRTDTEVLLHLYRLLGIDFIKELNGDFAIALLDILSGTLYLIRDRIGVKPLYYHLSDDSLLFGSEVKAILAAGLPGALNPAQLQNYFVFKYVPGNETLFREVRRVPPAHYLEFNLRSRRAGIRRYWSLSKDPDLPKQRYEDLQGQLRCLLADSTAIRLMADVPVGVFFSGGVDSSIIASLLRDNSRIKYYTAKKNEDDLRREGSTSDFHFAGRLADLWGLDLRPIDIGNRELNLDMIRKIAYYSDDLIADGSQIPSYLITQHSSETSTVMLSGMGGDELFFGYKGHLLILLSAYMDAFPKFFSRILAGALEKLKQGKGWFKSYRRYLHQFGKYYVLPDPHKYGMFGIVGDYENSVAILKEADDSSLRVFQNYFRIGTDPFESTMSFELENFLVKNLHYLDRTCMANSVEGRVPYLDHRIIEFAYSLPSRHKLSPLGKTKKILKDAFASELPPDLLKRRKAAFGMPLRSLLGRMEKIQELLDRDFFAAQGFFSLEAIDRIVGSHLTGAEDNSALIFALISFQEWHKLFLGS